MKRMTRPTASRIRRPSGSRWVPAGRMFPGRAPYPPEAISAAIRSTTNENDILLDPFSACGVSAVEALRLGRRAVLIELNPLTAFFAEVLLRPASLPRLEWGFQDVRQACVSEIAGWYADDRMAAEQVAELRIPYWHPASRPPDGAPDLRYPADYLNRRTTAALSVILHAIDNLAESSTHAALRAAFAAALEYCHPEVPASREINPWTAFEGCFLQLYELKKETNRILKHAAVGRSFDELMAGRANVVILGRCAEDASIGIPDGSIDGLTTAVAGRRAAGRIPLTEIQAAWLRIALDGARDIVADSARGESRHERHEQILAALHGARRTLKPGSTARVYLPDRGETDLHGLLRVLEQSGLAVDRIRYRPDPKAQGFRGGYDLHSRVVRQEEPIRTRIPESALREKLAASARARFRLHGAKAAAENILHAFYQQLNGAEISTVSKYSIQDFLAGAVEPFAKYRNGKLALKKTPFRGSGKSISPASARQAILDAELLAADSQGISQATWENAIEAFSKGGLTLEDAYLLRKTIRPAEVERRLWKRAAGLLRGWGRALGYPVGPAKGKGILWKASAGRTYMFSPDGRDIRVMGRSKDAAAEWGSLTCLDLERKLAEWCVRHPDRDKGLSDLLLPLEDLIPEEEDNPQGQPAPTGDQKIKVLDNRKICDRHFLMTVELPKRAAGGFTPGQFFHLLCDPAAGKDGSDPLTLRRPLSIHRVRYPGFDPSALARAEDLPEEIRCALVRHPARIEFLYRVVGEGTERLSRVRKGAVLPAIGPCGNGFSIGDERTAVIVAGGIGIAPLAALAEQLRFCGKEVLVYIGAAGKDMLNLAVTRGVAEAGERDLLDAIESEFHEIGATVLTVCTDDGSAGAKGFVTEMLAEGIRGGCIPRESVRLYACGPEGMLSAVARIAASNGMDCQVSLEERMACGIGACYSCTATVGLPDGTTRKQRVCREGPVFNARDILWKA